MPNTIVLTAVTRGEELVAAAFHLQGETALYGRNWGCSDEFKFLHFEACYYQAIEYAIKHNIACVQAGAQGTHKLQRGYLPARTFSTHHFLNSSFQNAVSRYLLNETQAIELEIVKLNAVSPFKKTHGDPQN